MDCWGGGKKRKRREEERRRGGEEEGRRGKREERRKGGGREASAVLLGCGLHTLHNAADKQDTNMYPHTYRCLCFFTEMPVIHTLSTRGAA